MLRDHSDVRGGFRQSGTRHLSPEASTGGLPLQDNWSNRSYNGWFTSPTAHLSSMANYPPRSSTPVERCGSCLGFPDTSTDVLFHSGTASHPATCRQAVFPQFTDKVPDSLPAFASVGILRSVGTDARARYFQSDVGMSVHQPDDSGVRRLADSSCAVLDTLSAAAAGIDLSTLNYIGQLEAEVDRLTEQYVRACEYLCAEDGEKTTLQLVIAETETRGGIISEEYGAFQACLWAYTRMTAMHSEREWSQKVASAANKAAIAEATARVLSDSSMVSQQQPPMTPAASLVATPGILPLSTVTAIAESIAFSLRPLLEKDAEQPVHIMEAVPSRVREAAPPMRVAEGDPAHRCGSDDAHDGGRHGSFASPPFSALRNNDTCMTVLSSGHDQSCLAAQEACGLSSPPLLPALSLYSAVSAFQESALDAFLQAMEEKRTVASLQLQQITQAVLQQHLQTWSARYEAKCAEVNQLRTRLDDIQDKLFQMHAVRDAPMGNAISQDRDGHRVSNGRSPSAYERYTAPFIPPTARLKKPPVKMNIAVLRAEALRAGARPVGYDVSEANNGTPLMNRSPSFLPSQHFSTQGLNEETVCKASLRDAPQTTLAAASRYDTISRSPGVPAEHGERENDCTHHQALESGHSGTSPHMAGPGVSVAGQQPVITPSAIAPFSGVGTGSVKIHVFKKREARAAASSTSSSPSSSVPSPKSVDAPPTPITPGRLRLSSLADTKATRSGVVTPLRTSAKLLGHGVKEQHFVSSSSSVSLRSPRVGTQSRTVKRSISEASPQIVVQPAHSFDCDSSSNSDQDRNKRRIGGTTLKENSLVRESSSKKSESVSGSRELKTAAFSRLLSSFGPKASTLITSAAPEDRFKLMNTSAVKSSASAPRTTLNADDSLTLDTSVDLTSLGTVNEAATDTAGTQRGTKLSSVTRSRPSKHRELSHTDTVAAEHAEEPQQSKRRSSFDDDEPSPRYKNAEFGAVHPSNRVTDSKLRKQSASVSDAPSAEPGSQRARVAMGEPKSASGTIPSRGLKLPTW